MQEPRTCAHRYTAKGRIESMFDLLSYRLSIEDEEEMLANEGEHVLSLIRSHFQDGDSGVETGSPYRLTDPTPKVGLAVYMNHCAAD